MTTRQRQHMTSQDQLAHVLAPLHEGVLETVQRSHDERIDPATLGISRSMIDAAEGSRGDMSSGKRAAELRSWADALQGGGQ